MTQLGKEASIGKALQKLKGLAVDKVPSAYSAAKRYVARNPRLSGVLPDGVKKIKANKAGDIASYVNPKTGYKHTKDAPSLLTTIGSAAATSPRLLKNPKLDKWSKRGYLATLLGSGASAVNDANDQRVAYDKDVQASADVVRGKGKDVIADLVEQGKSSNLIKRLLGFSKYRIPDTHVLSALNPTLTPASRSATKEAILASIHGFFGRDKAPVTLTKALFKPPVVTSGIIGDTVKNYLGKPRTAPQMLKNVVTDALTPEAVAKMKATPKGRLTLALLRKAQNMDPEKVSQHMETAQDKWEQSEELRTRAKQTYDLAKRLKARRATQLRHADLLRQQEAAAALEQPTQ